MRVNSSVSAVDADGQRQVADSAMATRVGRGRGEMPGESPRPPPLSPLASCQPLVARSSAPSAQERMKGPQGERDCAPARVTQPH